MDLAICTVLPLKQDLAYLKLTAFFHDFFASKLYFTVLPLVWTWLIRTVLPLKQDLAYLKLTAFSRDFSASKLCFTVLPLVRTWLIHMVLPFKQDLAYLKLTASQSEKFYPFININMFTKRLLNNFCFLFSLIKLKSLIFRDFYASKIVFYGPTVGMDLAYSYGPTVETGLGLLQVNRIFP